MKLVRSLLAFLLPPVLLLGFVPVSQAQQTETQVVADPGGLFTVPVPTSWQADATPTAVTLTAPEGSIVLHVLAAPAADPAQGTALAWERVRPGFNLPIASSSTPPSAPGVEATQETAYRSDDPNRVFAAYTQQVQGVSYVVLIDASLEGLGRRSAQFNQAITGLKIAAIEASSLVGVAPKPITPELIAQLEAYIQATMPKLGVPGASVAIVQGDQVVYSQGFGVTEQGGSQPVTPDTRMMIGSTGKTMTTLMMAQLVDEGRFRWDTPVVEVLPSFALADPQATNSLRMEDLVCACTGVPRRDLELGFSERPRTAEEVLESLRGFSLFTPPGEAFQYSNQMVSAGGYIATLAAGGAYGSLYQDYLQLMQQRVFDPIGMSRTTFSFDEVRRGADFATPHSQELDLTYRPLPLSTEQVMLEVIAPAGAPWSTASDMARYLVLQLQNGVTPDGTRLVSEANLLETRTPRVAISANASYGLGWIIERYKGLRVVQHAGNTLGFTSEFAFVPEADFGIVVLTNAQVSNAFNQAVRVRLLELVYGQPMEFDTQVQFALEAQRTAVNELQTRFVPLDEAAVAPFLWTFSNDALGEVALSLEDGRLMLATPDWSAELRPVRGADGKLSYLLAGPPLTGVPFTLAIEQDGTPVLTIATATDRYRFAPVPAPAPPEPRNVKKLALAGSF